MPRPVLPRDSGLRWVQMCMRVGLKQTKNGFLSRCALHEVDCRLQEFLVDRLHALFGERPSVLAFLLAPRSGLPRISGRRADRVLRLLFGIEVIKIAEELTEAVHRWQELVAVAEVVLAELSRCIPLRLEQFGNCRVLDGPPLLRRWQSHFQQSSAQRALPGDEGGAAGGAGLPAVVVGENRAFAGDAVDVWRSVTHHATVVPADVQIADVIAHDDEDVRRGLLAAAGPVSPAPWRR